MFIGVLADINCGSPITLFAYPVECIIVSILVGRYRDIIILLTVKRRERYLAAYSQMQYIGHAASQPRTYDASSPTPFGLSPWAPFEIICDEAVDTFADR